MSRLRLKYDLASSNSDSLTTGYISDTLLSVFTLRIFSAVSRQFTQFETIISVEEERRRKSWFIGNLQWAIQSALVLVLEFTCMYYVIRSIELGVHEVGTAAQVQSYVASLAGFMWGMGRSLIKVRTAFADAYEMAEKLDYPETESVVDGQTKTRPPSGITMNHVSFGYTPEQMILKRFSFEFKPGRTYGIIGKTGSGKSTLIKLLERFYEPQSGVISIGGQSIATIDKNTLRKMITLVPQIPIFPSVSIREAIMIGRPDASEAEVIRAAELACCDFIWQKPEGLDTLIGERGVKLSGGEAQRLAIAAAVLQNPEIIIMDEPTSALDSATEYLIQRAIKNCFAGKTMIVIAHRLSTVAVLDEILHLDEGRLIAHGSHTELLVTSDAYNNLWSLQTNPQILAHE
jgi:ATP-binding cassette subfamily B protein